MVYRANSSLFDLPPGKSTKRLKDIRLRDQWAQKGYEVFLLRSGTIPDGNYTYIVTLMPDLGSDSGKVPVFKPGPPRLITPHDNAILDPAGEAPTFS
ncbi:MAG: hypothetical protein N3E40_03660 [Dehalococcoidia bacterium]|nr:hypothetical protein [Dehalococcoidia bacterium]